MVQEISFIHAADIHLDSPFQGLTNLPGTIFETIRLSTFHAFDHLITFAIQKEVDFILLVGDLFDNEKQSLKAQIYLKKAFEQLKNHDIHVYLSYGNHDYMSGNPYQISFPNNVHIFPGETVTSFSYQKEGREIASIYGFSYENRAITKNKTKEFQIKNKKIPFHIAMLHGSVSGNKLHDPYAPFNITDLHNTPFHYWALGHIHKRDILSENPPVIYPGNLQGRHRKESGEKGFYYVEMSEKNNKKQFVKSHVIQFETVNIQLAKNEEINRVRRYFSDLMVNIESIPMLYSLEISGFSEHYQQYQDGVFEELIEIFNEENRLNKQWGYIYNYSFQLNEPSNAKTNHFFIGEVEKSMDKLDINEAIKELFNHRDIRQFIEPIDEQKLKREAASLLINELTDSRRYR